MDTKQQNPPTQQAHFAASGQRTLVSMTMDHHGHYKPNAVQAKRGSNHGNRLVESCLETTARDLERLPDAPLVD